MRDGDFVTIFLTDCTITQSSGEGRITTQVGAPLSADIFARGNAIANSGGGANWDIHLYSGTFASLDNNSAASVLVYSGSQITTFGNNAVTGFTLTGGTVNHASPL